MWFAHRALRPPDRWVFPPHTSRDRVAVCRHEVMRPAGKRGNICRFITRKYSIPKKPGGAGTHGRTRPVQFRFKDTGGAGTHPRQNSTVVHSVPRVPVQYGFAMQLGRPEWPCSIEAFKVSIRAWQSVNPVPLPVLYSYNTSKRAYRATVHRRLRGGGGALHSSGTGSVGQRLGTGGTRTYSGPLFELVPVLCAGSPPWC